MNYAHILCVLNKIKGILNRKHKLHKLKIFTNLNYCKNKTVRL